MSVEEQEFDKGIKQLIMMAMATEEPAAQANVVALAQLACLAEITKQLMRANEGRKTCQDTK